MVWYVKTYNSDDACKKIMCILRAFGMFPLDSHCRPRLKLALFSTALILILTINSVYWLVNQWIIGDGIIHYYLYSSRHIFEIVTVFVIIWSLLYKRHQLRAISFSLKEVESAFMEEDKGWNWCINPKTFFCVILLTILLHLSQGILWSFKWTAIHVEQIFTTVFICHFLAFYDMIRYCLLRVHKNEKYELYPKLYNLIQSSSEYLNNIYGPVIFCILTSYFLSLIHQIYQFLSIPNMKIVRFISLFFTTIYYTLIILQIILACNGLSREGKKFNTTLYNVLVQSKSELIDCEEILFHFELCKGFEFNASGLFVVNRSLVCSMIITATTYLVILLQYSNNGDRNEDNLKINCSI